MKSINYVESELNSKVELNIDFVKRNLVDLIYKQSVLEGIAITYSDTETLVNEGRVHNMTTEDVTKMINLKRSWEFIMDKDVIQYLTNYAILCQINQLVEYVDEYKKLLINYYEDKDENSIKNFLKKKCWIELKINKSFK